LQYPEFETNASKVNLVEVTSAEYYGKGYQDIKTRVPYIGNTREELDWAPKVDLKTALRKIMETYRTDATAASDLLNES
jgi:nucleoside-diphosphate-sugar epimerase